MNILIHDDKARLTVDIETREAPCPGCVFFKPRADDSPATCKVEDRGLSSAVIDSCARFGWRKDAE
jgi:hypothetical protein